MKAVFHIRRTKQKNGESYIQDIPYKYHEASETVASALLRINSEKSVDPIEWECSCLQKRCGACAMRINGKPRLACDAFLEEFKEKDITLEPLRKFPCVKDLRVDRSVMRQALADMRLYRNGSDTASENEADMYDASRCLQCGICLEVCPNYVAGGDFYGTAAAVPYYRKLSERAKEKSGEKETFSLYGRHIYEGCAKSLSCHDICPAGIDTERLLVKNSRAAIWRRGL